MFLWMPILRLYGAVVYLSYETNDRKINISFAIFKSKVATLRSLTLARLELMVVLVGARLEHLQAFRAHLY